MISTPLNLKNGIALLALLSLFGCASTSQKLASNEDDDEKIELTGSAIKRKPRDIMAADVKTVSVEDYAKGRSQDAANSMPKMP